MISSLLPSYPKALHTLTNHVLPQHLLAEGSEVFHFPTLRIYTCTLNIPSSTCTYNEPSNTPLSHRAEEKQQKEAANHLCFDAICNQDLLCTYINSLIITNV